jgi:hypothetical protein
VTTATTEETTGATGGRDCSASSVLHMTHARGTTHLLPRSVSLALTAGTTGVDGRQAPWSVDQDYWLGHREGFRVDGPGKRSGVVEHVVYRTRLDRPDKLAVTSGIWRPRTDEVRVQDVVEVRPAEQRLVVRGAFGAAERPSVWTRAQQALRGAQTSSK